ncbi:MAG TPA: hypothetical protein VNH18_17800 [Bryobacteraceae bacterium]|nr:hypothetical protein [Bryobacteraceae bacterium]
MKTIVLTFAAIAVSFAAQAPATKDAPAGATSKTEVTKHVKKHAKKSGAVKPTAAAPAAAK